MPLEAGASFAGYTVVQWLGSGPLSDVYLVSHPQPPGHYALKIPKPTTGQDRPLCLRFCREGRLALPVRHPNLVALHDIGEFGDHAWAAREYVDGTSAANLLRRFPDGIPTEIVCQIVGGIGAGLDYLHSLGYLHRGVKPTNMLLAELERSDLRVTLTDFATACRPLRSQAEDLNAATLAYTAPEDVLADPVGDFRADQYALAASALHLLTGVAPLRDGDPPAVVTQLIYEPPPRPGDRRPDLARLDHVFTTALAKNPADRFDSCRDFAAALAAASQG